MKKLLLIAILMLALVFTVVACTETPAGTDTTAADTTAETPTEEATTEAPTEDATTEAPTEEPTAEPTEEPTEEVTTEEPTEEVTTEEPTEAPTADPADPVWIIEPDDIAGITTVNNASATKTDDGFASLTATGGDPWIMAAGYIGDMPEYLVIRYRTNTNKRGEIFTSDAANPAGGKSFVFDYNANGDWNLMIFHLPTVAPYMVGNSIGHIRYDFFVDVPAEGTFLEVAYMAFFNTAEYALAYDFAQYPPYIEATDAAAGKVGHSFDTFYVNGQMYFEADGGAGDKLTAIGNTIPFNAGETHDSLSLRGWIGFGQPIDQFGYFVDNYNMVYDEFKQATEDGVLAAGGANATRFQINVPLAELEEGVHTVGFVVKLEDGTVVRLRENLTVVIIPEHVDEEIVLGIRANGGPFSNAKNFGQRFTVAEGFLKNITITNMATYADGNTNKWNVTIWAWNTDYATTVAGTPLYTVNGENHNDNQHFVLDVPAAKLISGDIYYEITYVEGSAQFTGWIADGGVAEGVETYVGGSLAEGTYGSSIVVGVPATVEPEEHLYVADGLVALYDGSKNNRAGHNTAATVWEDLIGKNNVDITINETNYFTEEGLVLNTAQNYFPGAIVDVVNGDAFTVEISLKDLSPDAPQFATLMNSTNDRFALFYRVSSGVLEYKFAGNKAADRNIVNNALPLLQDVTITITYDVNGNSIIYLNGEAVSTMPACGAMGAGDLFFGHAEGNRYFEAVYRSIRFYDRALTPEEVKYNADVDMNKTPDEPETPVEPVLPALPETGMTFSETLYHGIKTPDTTIFTIEAWLKLDTAARAGVIYGNYSSAVPPLRSVSLEIHENGVPRFYYTSSDAQNHDVRFNDVHVNTGEWVHLVVTYNAEANLLYCYVNGELAQTVNPTTDAAHKNMTSLEVCDHAPMAIGGDLRNGNGQWFKGQLASVTVYNDLRTADEVKADMSAALNAPNADGLVAAYDLSAYGAGAPEDILDLSGNGYHVTKGADDIIG